MRGAGGSCCNALTSRWCASTSGGTRRASRAWAEWMTTGTRRPSWCCCPSPMPMRPTARSCSCFCLRAAHKTLGAWRGGQGCGGPGVEEFSFGPCLRVPVTGSRSVCADGGAREQGHDQVGRQAQPPHKLVADLLGLIASHTAPDRCWPLLLALSPFAGALASSHAWPDATSCVRRAGPGTSKTRRLVLTSCCPRANATS